MEIRDDLEPIGLSGTGYDREGNPVATWKGSLAHADQDSHLLVYYWKGNYTVPKLANLPFHGIGGIEFGKKPVIGWFWNVNEVRPTKTTRKSTQLRRVPPENIDSMLGGSSKAIAAIVKKTLADW